MAINENIRHSWEEGFTEPKEHSDEKFRYLIHGVMHPSLRMTRNVGFLQIAIDDMQRGNRVKLQNINLLRQPNRIADKEVISTSLIDQDHRETWAPTGYILRTPFGNIVDTSPEDMGTLMHDIERVRERARQSIKRTSDQLLNETSSYQYNEVVLEGKTDQGNVEIAGVYVKVYPDGTPVDETMTNEMQRIARQNNFPLVEITEKVHVMPDQKTEVKPTFEKGGIQVTCRKNGVGYSFGYYKNEEQGKDFFYINKFGGKKLEQPDREQFEAAIQLLESEMTEEEHEQHADIFATLRQRFEAFNYRRRNPVSSVLRDKDEKPVGFHLVHDDNEYFVHLKYGSYEYKPNYRKRMEQALMDSMRPMSIEMDRNNLGTWHLNELERMIEEDDRRENKEELLALIIQAKEKIPEKRSSGGTFDLLKFDRISEELERQIGKHLKKSDEKKTDES